MNKIKEYIKTLLKLAIQNNPEVLKVVRNAKVENNAAFEAKHPRKNDGTFTETNSQSFYNEDTKTIELKGNELGSTDEEIRENGLKYFKENYQGKKFDNPELKGILFSRAGSNKLKSNSADIEKIKAIPALKDIVEKGEYMGSEDLAHPRQDGIIKFHRINHDVSINGQKENMSVLIGEDRDENRFYNLNNKTYIAENSSRVIRAKGRADEEFSINIITDNREDFNPDIKNNVQNNKEQDMALIDELKKLITKVENDKGEDMDDNKEKIENEKTDKREIIRQIMAIAGKHEDNEDVRTIAKLAEKLAYDKSEAGTADNECDDEEEVKNKKVKNEDEEDEKKYEDLKKDVKEDVENKCKNSVDNAKGGYFDKMNEIYNAAIEPKKENLYVSRADRIKAAEEYFGK